MKQCPECQRTYGDELNFCLEDGTVLRAYQDDEVTVVAPEPAPGPPQTLHARKRIGTVLGGIGTIVVIVLWVGVKLAPLIADRQGSQDRQASATDGPSPSTPSYSISPSPGSSPVPPCAVLENCPSPSPTSTASPQPSPTVASPSPNEYVSQAELLRGGTYQGEFSSPINEDGVTVARTLKIQFTFNADGTYSGQGFATIPSTGTSDRLFLEEKGNYSVANDVLTLRNRLQRKLDFDDDSWLPWAPAKDSNLDNRLRSLSPTTFQMYMSSPPAWITFSKL